MGRYLIVLGVLFWVGAAAADDEDLTVESPHGYTVKFNTGTDNPFILQVTSKKPCTEGYSPVKMHLDPALGLEYEWVEVSCGKVVDPTEEAGGE